MGGAGGAVLNYETVDVVMPEAYEGPMGCAAVVNCVRSYPNDWSVVGDYGPGEGDQGQLYAASYATSLVGGRANMWFMVCVAASVAIVVSCPVAFVSKV